MKKILLILIAFMAMTTANAQQANNPKKAAKEMLKDKKAGAKSRKALEKEFGIQHDKKLYNTAEQVYIFGINYSPTDSTVYFTDQMVLRNVKIEKKTGFLQFRNLYSKQLTDHMEGKGELNRISCVVFNQKYKKLAKKYRKMMNKYQKKNYQIKALDQTEFKFNILKDGE